MNRFWNWVKNEAEPAEPAELHLNGAIAEESWLEDDVTPAQFRAELEAHPGDVTVWINSPGGCVFAASQIYTMLRNHPGKVTVKIDGIAASAASVVAMAGEETLISPTGMLMCHNPMTCAMGNKADMEKAIALLDEVKESIINAYELKTGLSRTQLSHLMDAETWMNAGKAIELGFADNILTDSDSKQMHDAASMGSYSFSRRQVTNALLNKAIAKQTKPTPAANKTTISVASMQQRLSLLTH